jgi:lysophospholipase L1-like esterase
MKPGLSTDGVHPNRRAYALMRKALEAALAGQ